MSTVALHGLLDYLQATLAPENRKWLAEHLLQSSEDLHPYTREELVARAEEAEADIAAGRFTTEEEMEAFMDNALLELKQRQAA